MELRKTHLVLSRRELNNMHYSSGTGDSTTAEENASLVARSLSSIANHKRLRSNAYNIQEISELMHSCYDCHSNLHHHHTILQNNIQSYSIHLVNLQAPIAFVGAGSDLSSAACAAKLLNPCLQRFMRMQEFNK